MTRNRRERSHGDVQSRQLISITDATLMKGVASAAVFVDAGPAPLLGALVAQESSTDTVLRRAEFVDQYCRDPTSQGVEDAFFGHRRMMPHRMTVLPVTKEDDSLPISIDSADAAADLGAFGVCQQRTGHGGMQPCAS